ncbi:MAG: hypothetical protein ACI8TP_003301 [Acidimicrobiales bacterium]|jgi:hypothetical protein
MTSVTSLAQRCAPRPAVRATARVALLATSFVAAACSQASDPIDTAPLITTSLAPNPSSSQPATTQASRPAGPAATDPPPEGEPFVVPDVADKRIDVVGVRYDDVLDLFGEPSGAGEVVLMAVPFDAADRLFVTGDAIRSRNTTWWKVTARGQEVWADAGFLGLISPRPRDLSDQLARLEADDLETLAEAVADMRANDAPTTVVLATEPSGTDPEGVVLAAGDVSIDVIGVADDRLRGERIYLEFDHLVEGEGNAVNIVGYRITAASVFEICMPEWAALSDCG